MNYATSVPLARDPLRAPIEHAVSEHIGRQWQVGEPAAPLKPLNRDDLKRAPALPGLPARAGYTPVLRAREYRHRCVHVVPPGVAGWRRLECDQQCSGLAPTQR